MNRDFIDSVVNQAKEKKGAQPVQQKWLPQSEDLSPHMRNIMKQLEPVTKDRGIMKMLISEGSKPVADWKKGSNAKFHYSAHSYIPESEHAKLPNHSSICTHGKLDDDADDSRPVRVQLANSRDQKPFELRIGLGFNVPAFETCIKTMNIGERARFLVSPEHTTGYLDLATALRKQESSPPGHAQVFSGCCGGRAMLEAQNDANADLNLVANMCAPLEFEFELIEVQEPGSFEKEGWEMSVEEKWEEANRAKEAGVVLYNEGKFGEASDKFGKALGLLESVGMSSQVQELKHQKNEQSRMDELERHSRWLKRIKSRDVKDLHVEKDSDDGSQDTLRNTDMDEKDDNPKLLNLDKLETLLRTTRLNYVACKLKLEDYAAAITQASEILKDDPDNLKALFRRGQAYTRMGRDLDLAGQDLDRCKDILSSSGDVATLNEVKREIQLVKQKLSKHEKVEKQIFARMFV